MSAEIILALLFLIAIPLSAQQYYGAVISPATHYIHDVDNYEDCNGPAYDVQDFTVNWGTLTLRQDLQLLMKNGKWIQSMVSETGISSAGVGQSLYTSALDSRGMVTTSESGSGEEGGANYNSIISTETLDLNTGKYTWHRVINATYGGNCPASRVEAQDRHADLPIALDPTEGPTLVGYAVNPYATYLLQLQVPIHVDQSSIADAPTAQALSADGISAVAIVIQSPSSNPISLQLSAPGFTGYGSLGGLSPYYPSFLSNPSPSSATELMLNAPNYCESDGTNQQCAFIALLWSPAAMPLGNGDLQSGTFQNVGLSVTASQIPLNTPVDVPVTLQPPPVVLVHGIWSSAEGAWPRKNPAAPSFYNWLGQNYPHNDIWRVDYSFWNYLTFADTNIQDSFLSSSLRALLQANVFSLVASREIDVVAHSMGGLVTRQFINQNQPAYTPNLVHKLITVGTPHSGSALATQLYNNKDVQTSNQEALSLCQLFSVSPCDLGHLMAAQGKKVDTGVLSLETGIQNQHNTYETMVGMKPSDSATERILNLIIGAFLPGQTIDAILGVSNDTIVAADSQDFDNSGAATINGVVHTSLVGPLNTGETSSPQVWSQALYWLMGGQGQQQTNPMLAQQSGGARPPQRYTHKSVNGDQNESQGIPIVDLTGYTQVDPSNVSFNPPSNSSLTANTAVSITAASQTKQITEVLLFQGVSDPSDTSLLYTTQAPFSIPFTPTRLGSVQFAAFAVFSDMTYCALSLQYTVLPAGNPLDLHLVDVPGGALPVGISTEIRTQAGFSNGLVDVTSAATLTAQSGTSQVFSVGQNGIITTTGKGVDWLNASYNGFNTSAQISVGGCSYVLSPTNQIVDAGGGSVNVAVTTADGCAWTASGGDAWLTFNNASGSGNGILTLTAAANNTGASRAAFVTLPGLDVAVTQPATPSCMYSVNPNQLNLPSSGGNGLIQVTSSCPIVVSSDSDWLSAMVTSSGVLYAVPLNPNQSPRQGNITIGNAIVPVTQAAGGQTFTLTLSSAPPQAGSIVATPPPIDGVYAAGTQVCLTPVPNAGWNFSSWTGDPLTNGCLILSGNMSVTANFVSLQAFQFVPVAPCRVADTRGPNGEFGGPPIQGGTIRNFVIPDNLNCGIPTTAAAYSLNVTVVPHGPLGYLTVWPTGESQPGVSTLNSLDGRTKANAAIVPAGMNGAASVFASNTTDLVLDLDGYFTTGGSQTLDFYPLTPCRVIDTRGGTSNLGGPFLTGGVERDFPVLTSSCIPSGANPQAYSFNVTVVPHTAGTALGYLSIWPQGETQPTVSTLNNPTATDVANAAIVPAGANGAVAVFPSNDTDLVIDINGYFAPPGTGGLSLYPTAPCRVLDTRGVGSGNPIVNEDTVNVAGSACSPPATAQAYVFNTTVVPSGALGFLSLWPDGQNQPVVSTLNALDGFVTSNMAIVPTTNGSIDAYASNLTQLVLDISSYFAP